MIINNFKKLFVLETEERSERVFFAILSSFFILTITCFFLFLFTMLTQGQHDGAPLALIVVLTFFVTLGWHFYRKKFRNLIFIGFLGLLLLIITNISLMSGTKNYFSILLVVFYIVIACMVLDGFNLFLSLISAFLVYIFITYLEIFHIVRPNLAWQTTPMDTPNVIAIMAFLLIITFVSWLFNNEIKNYIRQLKITKDLLQKERDLLEENVHRRTEQLQKAQLEKLAEINRLAEFGKITQGLFHDLTSPLTALSLNLDQLKKEKDWKKVKECSEEISIATGNMKKLIDSTLNYSHNIITKSSFSLVKELENISLLCNYKANRAGVKLNFQSENDLKIFGNRVRFSQLISNLVSNSLEAFDRQQNNDDKTIVIVFNKENNKSIVIRVKDNAEGMPDKIRKSIFNPFFTTKNNSGHSGIGLSICQDIVESEFMGEINVISELGHGTEFIIKLRSIVDEQD